MTYFTDFFNIEEQILDDYGAFNISLINDLPLFIDPFLLFGSTKQEYIELHDSIIAYLTFLKSKASTGKATNAEIKSWYKFSEVKQNWLGYSIKGNGGSGLGEKFGNAMSSNMDTVYYDLGNETITVSSHIEKIGLFQFGIGKDNTSDFSCNLIKSYLLQYTEDFAKKHLDKSQIKEFNVGKVYFDSKFEKWMSKKFTLPFFKKDFILLSPKDLLTKDDNWINSHDLRGNFVTICGGIPNVQLRSEINKYFQSKLPSPVFIGKGRKQKQKNPSNKETSIAVNETIQKFPTILDYYIKEKNKEDAKNISAEKVQEVETIFKTNIIELISQLILVTQFYDIKPESSFEEALKRVNFLKDVIENNDGYKLFYFKGSPIKREADLQIIYRLTWFSSPLDVNSEVDNGRGAVDYVISNGKC